MARVVKKGARRGSIADLYSTNEAARRLGVTPGNVRRLVHLGRLVPEETGSGDLYFSRAELDRYAASRSRRGRPRSGADG